nr:hypothetical protein Iba_chr10bCG3730 [Ipomoea batatas]
MGTLTFTRSARPTPWACPRDCISAWSAMSSLGWPCPNELEESLFGGYDECAETAISETSNQLTLALCPPDDE